MHHTGAAALVQSCTIIPPRCHLGIHDQCHRWRVVSPFLENSLYSVATYFLPSTLVLGEEITPFHPDGVVQY